MWATTKPKRITPVAAITTFLPMDEARKLRAGVIGSP